MKTNVIYKLLGCALISTPLLAYGVSQYLPFINTLCVLLSIIVMIGSYFLLIKPELQSVSVVKNNESESELINAMEKLIEQEEVLQQYELMLSEQEVELPCNCGEVLFRGILIPNNENMCTCQSCKETYKVIISYDSFLINSELNAGQIFDKLNAAASEFIDKELE